MPPIALTPALLLQAYAAGLFPMAEHGEAEGVFWVDPPQRGVLPLDNFHVPRRLARTVLQQPYRITFNQAFTAVIAACAAVPRREHNTWINPTIRQLYGETHQLGFAHSVEAWQGDRLVGGLYGIALGKAFFGESMFSYARDSSKIALVHLVAHLTTQHFRLLDAQFTNPHLEQFGLTVLSRARYHQCLCLALAAGGAESAAVFPASSAVGVVSAFLQSSTHTS